MSSARFHAILLFCGLQAEVVEDTCFNFKYGRVVLLFIYLRKLRAVHIFYGKGVPFAMNYFQVYSLLNLELLWSFLMESLCWVVGGI